MEVKPNNTTKITSFNAFYTFGSYSQVFSCMFNIYFIGIIPGLVPLAICFTNIILTEKGNRIKDFEPIQWLCILNGLMILIDSIFSHMMERWVSTRFFIFVIIVYIIGFKQSKKHATTNVSEITLPKKMNIIVMVETFLACLVGVIYVSLAYCSQIFYHFSYLFGFFHRVLFWFMALVCFILTFHLNKVYHGVTLLRKTMVMALLVISIYTLTVMSWVSFVVVGSDPYYWYHQYNHEVRLFSYVLGIVEIILVPVAIAATTLIGKYAGFWIHTHHPVYAHHIKQPWHLRTIIQNYLIQAPQLSVEDIADTLKIPALALNDFLVRKIKHNKLNAALYKDPTKPGWILSRNLIAQADLFNLNLPSCKNLYIITKKIPENTRSIPKHILDSSYIPNFNYAKTEFRSKNTQPKLAESAAQDNNELNLDMDPDIDLDLEIDGEFSSTFQKVFGKQADPEITGNTSLNSKQYAPSVKSYQQSTVQSETLKTSQNGAQQQINQFSKKVRDGLGVLGITWLINGIILILGTIFGLLFPIAIALHSISFVMFIISLIVISRINETLRSEYWKKYMLYYLLGWGSKFAAALVISIAPLVSISNYDPFSIDALVNIGYLINQILSAIIIFFILTFTSGIFIVVAWNFMDQGLVQHQNRFSMDMFYNLKGGVKLMKLGGFLMLFLATSPIGSILRAFGLMKMGLQFKKFQDSGYRPRVQYATTPSDCQLPHSAVTRTRIDGSVTKNRILGYIRVKKTIDIVDTAKKFKISPEQVEMVIYDLVGDNIIKGDFITDGAFRLKK